MYTCIKTDPNTCNTTPPCAPTQAEKASAEKAAKELAAALNETKSQVGWRLGGPGLVVRCAAAVLQTAAMCRPVSLAVHQAAGGVVCSWSWLGAYD